MPAILNKPVLQVNSQGAAVKELQTLLQDYARISIDGIYGPSTEVAVKQFQKRMFMPQDGIVGNRTWRALFKKAPVDMPEMSVGYRGSEVAPMTVRLELNGFRSVRTFNQEYTEFTKNAVIAFQKAVGLSADGIVGDRTWFALSKLSRINPESAD
jgi:peptidoglycan hydrolase-like protein with peptidoglycan-binding domain